MAVFTVEGRGSQFFQIPLQLCKSQSQYRTLNKIFIYLSMLAVLKQPHIIVSGTLFLPVRTAYDVR